MEEKEKGGGKKMNELYKMANEMKQVAEKEPFRMSEYNPVCDPKMVRKITIDASLVEIIFTLDEYPMIPHQIWHLSVAGKLSESNLREVVSAFFPTGDVFEIPQEEIAKLGLVTVPRNLGKSGFDEISPASCRYTQKAFNGLTRTGIAAMLLSGKVS